MLALYHVTNILFKGHYIHKKIAYCYFEVDNCNAYLRSMRGVEVLLQTEIRLWLKLDSSVRLRKRFIHFLVYNAILKLVK